MPAKPEKPEKPAKPVKPPKPPKPSQGESMSTKTTNTSTLGVNVAWIAPVGVTSLDSVVARGGGGGGGALAADTNKSAGGGAGGQYVSSTNVSVTPGTTYNLFPGLGGTAGLASSGKNGGLGGESYFQVNGGAKLVVAKGGAGGICYESGYAGGDGSLTGAVGDTQYKGGDGGDGGDDDTGGGGGEGGCSNQDGGSTTTVTGGSGGDGGDGGNGGTNAAGSNGSLRGGGGGGGGTTLTSNRNGGAGAGGIVTIVYTCPAASVVTDTFNDNSQDVSKWIFTPAGSGTVTETNQRLELASGTAASTTYCQSQGYYDFTGSYMYAQLVSAGNQALASWYVLPVHIYVDSSNEVSVMVKAGVIYARKKVATVEATVGSTIAYDANVHKYFRIRESAGTTYWEYSTDGSTYSAIASVANPITYTNVRVGFKTLSGAEASGTLAAFDNMNVIPGVILTGTATASIAETDIVAGGKTIILTCANDTWVASGATFDGQRQNIIDGIDSAQGEGSGWDVEVKPKLNVSTVVRTSDTIATITLSAQAGYDITATETITATIPATALAGGIALVASPTFTITHTAAPSTDVKTVGGLARASVATRNGLAIASIKSINGLV